MIVSQPFDKLFPIDMISKLPLEQQRMVVFVMRALINQSEQFKNVVYHKGAINGKLPLIEMLDNFYGKYGTNIPGFCHFNRMPSDEIGGDFIELRPFNYADTFAPCEEANTILQGKIQAFTKDMEKSPVYQARIKNFANYVIHQIGALFFFGERGITPTNAQINGMFGGYDGMFKQLADFLSANLPGQYNNSIAGSALGLGAATQILDDMYDANELASSISPSELIIETSASFYKALVKDIHQSGSGLLTFRDDLVKGLSVLTYGGIQVVSMPTWDNYYRLQKPSVGAFPHIAVLRPKVAFNMSLEGTDSPAGLINIYPESQSLVSPILAEAFTAHGGKALLKDYCSLSM
jgi:hypothetical protein